MGLGKTAQISVYLKGLFESEQIKKVLIVVPSTLKIYWKEEIKKWSKGMRAMIFDAQKKSEREKSIEKLKKKGGILITSFGLVTTERLLLNDIRYDVLIMDEGHKAKNAETELRKNMMRVNVKHHRILLTGTPLQNNLSELWSVFDCVQPGLFGNQSNFTKEYATPIENGLTKDATQAQKDKSKELSTKLRNKYKSHFLRRTKRQIFKVKSVETSDEPLKDNELPLKTDLVIWLELSESQKKMYEHIISRDTVKNVIKSGAFINAFCLLTWIKKLWQHPLLLRKAALVNNEKSDEFFGEDKSQTNDESEENTENKTNHIELPNEEEQTKMIRMLELKDILNDAVKHYNDDNLDGILADSSKLLFLFNLLENLHKEGHKVLIYSMSKVMLNIIEKITKAANKFEYRRIDGDTEIEERDRIQKDFNKNPKIFMWLLTTKVGGCGLNLIGADRVIIFDPDWNPANDNQAVDRLYRIGQNKDVIIYRLITINGIEERIYRRQIHKQGLHKATVENDNNKDIRKYFSNQDLFELFEFEKDQKQCKTLKIVQKSEKSAKDNTSHMESEKLKKHRKFLKKWEYVIGISNNAVLHNDNDDVNEDQIDQTVEILKNYHYQESPSKQNKPSKKKKKHNLEANDSWGEYEGSDFKIKTRTMKQETKSKKSKISQMPQFEKSSDFNNLDLGDYISEGESSQGAYKKKSKKPKKQQQRKGTKNLCKEEITNIDGGKPRKRLKKLHKWDNISD